MICETCSFEEAAGGPFVVVLTRYRGGWLFSRHRERDTWETQGGHIEPGETPLEAALRELYEEGGVVAQTLTPLCGYYADRGDGKGKRYGQVFLAEAERIDPLPESEMAEVRFFPSLPENLSYPDITPKLFAYAIKNGGFEP